MVLSLILLGGLFALGLANQNLKIRVERLEQRLDAEGLTVERLAAPPVEPAPEVPFTVGYTAVPDAAAPAAPPRPFEPGEIEAAVEAEQPAERETLGGLFERLVAGRLLIWLGGIALVAAAVFLIRYSIDFVTPEV